MPRYRFRRARGQRNTINVPRWRRDTGRSEQKDRRTSESQRFRFVPQAQFRLASEECPRINGFSRFAFVNARNTAEKSSNHQEQKDSSPRRQRIYGYVPLHGAAIAKRRVPHHQRSTADFAIREEQSGKIHHPQNKNMHHVPRHSAAIAKRECPTIKCPRQFRVIREEQNIEDQHPHEEAAHLNRPTTSSFALCRNNMSFTNHLRRGREKPFRIQVFIYEEPEIRSSTTAAILEHTTLQNFTIKSPIPFLL